MARKKKQNKEEKKLTSISSSADQTIQKRAGTVGVIATAKGTGKKLTISAAADQEINKRQTKAFNNYLNKLFEEEQRIKKQEKENSIKRTDAWKNIGVSDQNRTGNNYSTYAAKMIRDTPGALQREEEKEAKRREEIRKQNQPIVDRVMRWNQPGAEKIARQAHNDLVLGGQKRQQTVTEKQLTDSAASIARRVAQENPIGTKKQVDLSTIGSQARTQGLRKKTGKGAAADIYAIVGRNAAGANRTQSGTSSTVSAAGKTARAGGSNLTVTDPKTLAGRKVGTGGNRNTLNTFLNGLSTDKAQGSRGPMARDEDILTRHFTNVVNKAQEAARAGSGYDSVKLYRDQNGVKGKPTQDIFGRLDVKEYNQYADWMRRQAQTGIYDNGTDPTLMTDEGLRNNIAKWDAQQRGIKRTANTLLNEKTNMQPGQIFGKVADPERRNDTIELADNYFRFEYSPEMFEGDSRESIREMVYNRIMEDRDTYEERTARMTEREKEAFDRQIDAAIEAANNPTKENTPEIYQSQYGSMMSEAKAYGSYISNAMAEQKRREKQAWYDNLVATKFVTENGTYNEALIPAPKIRKADFFSNETVAEPQGTELDKIYYWANHPEGMGIGTTRKEWFMSPEQLDTFNRMFAHDKEKGSNLAEMYLKGLDGYLSSAKVKYEEAFARETADIPVLGTVAHGMTFPVNVGAGLGEVFTAIAALAGNEEARDKSSNLHSATRWVGNIRDERGEKVDDWVVSMLGENAKGYAKQAMGILDSIGDNLFAMGAGTALAGGSRNAAMKLVQAIMSGEATAQSFVQDLDAGVDPTTAAIKALGQGAIEAITEKYSLETLLDPNLKELLGKPGQRAAYFAKSFLAEGSEEGASNLLGNAADVIVSGIRGNETEARRRYNELVVEQGLSDKQAERQILAEQAQQLGAEMLAGGISGGIFAGGQIISNRNLQSKAGQQARTNTKGSGIDALIYTGLESDKGSMAYQQATELKAKQEQGKTVSNQEAGRLAQTLETEANETLQAAMQGEPVTENQVERSLRTLKSISDVMNNDVRQERNGSLYLASTEDIRNAEGQVTKGAREVLIDGKVAQIEGVRSFKDKDGKWNLKLKVNGQEVDPDSILNTNYHAAQILRQAAINPEMYSGKFVETLLEAEEKGLIKQEIGKTLKDAKTVRMLSYMGLSADEISNITRINVKDNKMLANVWQQGALEHGENRQEQVKGANRKTEGIVKHDGSLYKSDEWNNWFSKLDENQKAQVDTIAGIAQRAGIEVDFRDMDSETYGLEGNLGNGRTGIAVNLGGIDYGMIEGEKTAKGRHNMLVTFGHEMTHWLQRNSMQGYNRLERFVANEYIRENGVDKLMSRLNKHMTGADNLSLEDALSEVVADSCDQILSDENVMRHIQDTDSKLYTEVKGFVRNLVDRFKTAMRNMSESASRDGRSMAGRINQISKVWLGAYDEAISGMIQQGEESNITNERFSKAGVDPETGKSVYISNFSEDTQNDPKRFKIVKLIRKMWSKTPIDLTIEKNGVKKTITARYDPTFDYSFTNNNTDAHKIAFANKMGTPHEKTVMLNLADDYVTMLQESVYDDSKEDEHDPTKTHEADMWHYFIDDIYYADQNSDVMNPYRITINIRELNNEDFVYSYSAEKQADENKKLSVPVIRPGSDGPKSGGFAQLYDEGDTGVPDAIDTGKTGNNIPSTNSIAEAVTNVNSDEAYREAVERGDLKTATSMLMEKLKTVKGVIPFMAPNWHAGENETIAKNLKKNDPEAIEKAAPQMAALVPENAVLIPMPGSSGIVEEGSWTMNLTNRIAELTGRPVVVALEGTEHESRQKAKSRGEKGASQEELGFRKVAEIPEGTIPIFIDNTVGSGITADAARVAMGGGMTLAYTKTLLSPGIVGLKNAIVTYESKSKGGALVPLSKRFDVSERDVRHSRAQQDDIGSMGIKELNDSYLDAVKNGDMESARLMVDEAARRTGYTIRAYHGSNNEFTTFRGGNRDEMWFGDRPQTAYERKHIYDTFLKMKNPYEVTYYIGADSEFNPSIVTEESRRNGHDGGIVHFKLNPDYVNGAIQIMSKFAETLPATDSFGDNFTFMPKGKDRENLAKPGEKMIAFMKRGAEENLYDWYVVSSSNQIKSAETVTYDDNGEVIPLSERFRTDHEESWKNTDIRYSKAQRDERADELRGAYQTAIDRVRELEQQMRDMKPEVDAWTKRMMDAQENGKWDELLPEYKKWEKGYLKVSNELQTAREFYKEANRAFDNYIEERDVKEEREAIKKSGLTEADWRRKQAINRYGYTTDFREAGYMLPNGKMLNFCGDKGQHYGVRGNDHRDIGGIYASSKYQGSAAMTKFMDDGNIRVMAETPGIDINKEPTADQYATIRQMARRFAGEEYFNVDFSDENGDNIDSIEYEGRVNPDKIVNDIKTFYKTGVATTQSVVSQFHYSRWTEEGMDVNAWMNGLTPGSLQTADEGVLLQAYKDLRMKISLSLKRQLDYKAKIEQLEGKENLTAEQREDLRATKNRLEIEVNKLARLEDEMYHVTSSEGYAGMMYRENMKLKDYIEGKTQDQVRQTVEEMVRQVQKAQAQIAKDREEIKKLAETQAIKTVKSYMSKSSLGTWATRLRKAYNSTMNKGEVEDRLAEMALKDANGQDIQGDIETLAQDLLDKMRGQRTDELDFLRGQTLYIGKSLAAELRAENSSIKELQSRIRGSGVTLKTGDNSRLEEQWAELRGKNGALVDVDGLNPIDQLHGIVDFIASQVEASRGINQNKVDFDEVALMVKAAVKNIHTFITDDPAARAQIENLMKQIQEIGLKTGDVGNRLEELSRQMDEVVLAGQKAKGWTTILQRDVADAIRYYNKTAAVAAQEEKTKVRKALIEQLRSENTRKLMEQRDKYEERMKKDRKARELAEDNKKLRSRITTNMKWIKTRLTAETDQKNIPEEAKKLARFLSRMLVEHDLTEEFRSVMNATREDLQDFRERLVRMDAADGEFDMDTDLDFLVIKAPNPDDNDYTLHDKVVKDLMDIESGLLEYRTAEGQGNVSLADRKAALDKIQDAVAEIRSVIQRRGEAFIKGKRYEVATLAEQMENEMGRSRFKGERKGFGRKARNAAVGAIGYGNLTPEYFFKNLRNGVMSLLHSGFQDAENRSGLEAAKAQAKIAKIAEETGYKNWDGQEKHKIRTKDGEIEITTEQLMALYATWKRESNQLRPEETAHLLHGGFVLAENKDDSKGKPRREKSNERPIRLNEDQAKALGGYLTDEQRAYVDAIVDYMSGELAELGNEASMDAYGIKKFTEQFYFPIKSWGGVLNKKSDAGITSKNDNRAMRQSFTKRIKANAQNAIEIGDFTPTAMKHIVGMITFNTVGPAVENMNKVLNQQLTHGEVQGTLEEPEDTRYKMNLRASFKNEYGAQALEYLEKFMADVNGGVTSQRTALDSLLSIFKKNAVAGSLSVAAQQPLSYIRAAMMINPKYLAQALSPTYWKGSYEEMMKHSGVAVIKKMGKFDMNFGRSMQDYITPEGMVSKGRKLYETISEKSTSLPEMMDAATWTRMWTACKLEQKALNPEMDPSSDEFLDKVGERFNEVMRRTQVYDSVMTKSQNMRNKRFYAKTLTSFMAEPTLSLNVLADAVQNAKEEGGKKNVMKALATFALSAAAQAGAKALFGAGRSPDKKKTKEENFWNRFGINLLSEANPMSLIPGYSQMMDLLMNGELNDDTMGVIGKAVETLDNIWNLAVTGETKKGLYRDLEDSVGQLIQYTTNIPAKNIMRDFRAMVNWFSGGTAGFTGDTYAQRPTSSNVLKYQLIDTLASKELMGLLNEKLGEAGYGTDDNAYYKRIYQAEKTGDNNTAEGMKEYILLKSKAKNPEKTMNSKLMDLVKKDEDLTESEKIEELSNRGMKDSDIASWILTRFKDGELQEEEAEKLWLEANSKKDANDAYFKFEQAKWEAETGEDVTDSDWFRINAAIESDNDSDYKEAVNEMKKHGYKEDDITEHAVSIVMNKYKEGRAKKEETKKELKKYDKSLTDDDIYWKLDRVDYKEQTGNDAGSGYYYRLKDAVNANKAADINDAVKTLLKHGITKEKIKNKLSDWKSDYLAAGTLAEKNRIRNAITIAYKAAGYTAEDANKVIDGWMKEKKKKN